MSLLLLESFDVHRTSADMALKWGSANSGVTNVGTRYGTGYCLASGPWNDLVWYGSAYAQTLIIGSAIKITSTNSFDIFRFRRDGGTEITLTYTGDATRRLQVRRAGTILADIISFNIVPGAWYYLEFSVTSDNAVGAFEVRINNSTIATGINVDTLQVGWPNQLYTGNQVYMDDVYLCDGIGPLWNGFQGDMVVEGRLVTGPGNYAQMTPLAGLNWQNVDEAQEDGDTTYNYSATAGQKDSFAHAATSLNGTVLGAQVTAFARKDDVGGRTGRAFLRSGLVDDPGPTDIIADSYIVTRGLHEVDPNGGGAWSKAAIDAAEIGYELVS